MTRFDRTISGFGLSLLLVAAVAGRFGAGPLAGLFPDDFRDSATPASPVDEAAALSGSTTSSTVAFIARSYDEGDCTVWDTADEIRGDRRTEVVACDEPHLMRVSTSVRMKGRADAYPDEAAFGEVMDDDCRPANERLLGAPLDPNGRYATYSIVPLEESWAHGDRTVWCGLIERRIDDDESDPPLLRSGPFDPTAQAFLPEVGTCGTVDVFAPVPCEGPHQWEVTGTVDLSGRAQTPPAEDDEDAWWALLGEECSSLATDHLGRPPADGLSAGWLPIQKDSWEAGNRFAACTVARWDGDRIVEVTGPMGRSAQVPLP